MLFKNDRISNEYDTLLTQNPRLRQLLQMLNSFIMLEFHKDVVITSIFRTLDEHKALYATTPNPPLDSPHCHWHAADIRSTDFNSEQITKIVAFCNQLTYPGTKGKSVSMYHAIDGGAPHLHIQYW